MKNRRFASLLKTTTLISIVTVCGLLMSTVGCAPSASQLQKVLEEHPEVLFAAMKKDPVKFIDTINEVNEQAKTLRESQQFEESFKNPLQAEIQDGRIMDGAKDAPITIVEYSDFQCPYCQQGHARMSEVLAAYPGKVRVLFKNYPIERLHPQAMKFAKFYEAIGQKDHAKASQYKDLMFKRQEDFVPKEEDRKGAKTPESAMARYSARVDKDLEGVIKGLGLNYAEIKKLAESETVAEIIKKDQAEAQKFGFSGTPGYLVNGVAIRGAYPVETFKQVIDRHLAAKK